MNVGDDIDARRIERQAEDLCRAIQNTLDMEAQSRPWRRPGDPLDAATVARNLAIVQATTPKAPMPVKLEIAASNQKRKIILEGEL